ncbi:MAG: hypothetical protein ACOH1R_05440 [Luteimonas sp.]
MRHRPVFAFLIAIAVLLPTARAETAAGAVRSDASVKARLDARGLKYVIDEDGDYRVTYSWKAEGRTQLVYVSGTAEEISGMKVREVFAPAANIGDKGLSAQDANALLRESRRNKLGSWEANSAHLMYVIKLPDSIDAATLEIAMDIAAELADNKEIEISGDVDEF